MLRDFLHVQLRLPNLVHNHRGVNGEKRRIITLVNKILSHERFIVFLT
jgi:hypothetical protein